MNPPPRPSMPRPSGIASHDLVFDIDMALVGVLGAITLVYLPRTITRYVRKSTRQDGWFIRRAHEDVATAPLPQSKEILVPNETSMQYPPQRFISVPADSTSSLPPTPRPLERLALSASSHSPPSRFRSYTSYVPVLGRVLGYRVLGLAVHQLIVLAAYITVSAVALFYQSDPTTNVTRAGWVVMSQMPIVFVLGTKNSVVTVLTGISYEKLNFIHRWVGRIMFIAALFHFVGWLVLWTKLGITRIAVQHNAWGLVAFFSLCFCALGSHPWIRARFYTVFYNSHIIGLLAMMVGVWKHQPEVAVPYVATCVALYGADQLARLAKTRVRKAVLTPLPDLGATQIYVPGLDKGWIAGQHVRIRILSLGVGPVGWTESHPFTIANAGSNSSAGLVLVCKSAGDWTSKLYKMANEGLKEEESRNVRVLVEGPYGGPGNTIITSFRGAMLVLGGSGITFGTSVLEDVVARSLRGDSNVQYLSFIWVVQHPSAANSYLASFVELVRRAAVVPDLQLTINIFYTRGLTDSSITPLSLPPNIQIRSGRPDLRKELDQTISSTKVLINSTGSSNNGVILAGCGPEGLISSVRQARSGTSDDDQKAVGGLELHTETFGW